MWSISEMANLHPNGLLNSGLGPGMFAGLVRTLMAPLVALLWMSWVPAAVALSFAPRSVRSFRRGASNLSFVVVPMRTT